MFDRPNIAANYAMIAVTFALPAESSEFLRRLRDRTGTERNGVRIVRGRMDDRTIEVLHTGVGEKVCRQRVEKFLQDQQFELLITAGFAGALSDELKAGDLLLAKNFSNSDLCEMGLAFSSLPIHIANLLTASALIDSSDERNRIARASGAAAVDMETEFIARICAEHGVPLVSLRVITDTPRQPFPAPMRVLFDMERQRTDYRQLSSYVLKNPASLWRLIRFGIRVAHARKALTEGIVDLVSHL
jgi:nucleoside phosphorylase